jgi:hypothetical protein
MPEEELLDSSHGVQKLKKRGGRFSSSFLWMYKLLKVRLNHPCS